MSWDIEAFRQKIEASHSFPGTYVFKFIVPTVKKEEVLSILPQSDLRFRSSANDKYISITAQMEVQSSEDVLDVYILANKIEGCIAL
jgi:uncharacterized protein